jgi:hypothetical protein
VLNYRDECRARWLTSKQGTTAADEGEAAQEHGSGASSTESAAEEHGLGISESSASEDMLEVSTDSDTDWRHDTDTTDSESEAPPARTSTHLPGYVPPSPARAAATTATIDSPDSVNAHPACQTLVPPTDRVPQVSHAHAGPGERHAREEGSGA